MKNKVTALFKTTKIGRHLSDRRNRIILIAILGFIFNSAYALYNGGLGVLTQSLWFISMGAYYLILSSMRLVAVLSERRNRQKGNVSQEIFVQRLTGFLLVVLAVVIAGLSYLGLTQSTALKYQEIIMISIAAYTFAKVILAIVSWFKTKKLNSPVLSTIRKIACADAAASVLSLQRSMLVTFGSMDSAKAYTLNMITGLVVFLIILALGLSMIIKRSKTPNSGTTSAE